MYLKILINEILFLFERNDFFFMFVRNVNLEAD